MRRRGWVRNSDEGVPFGVGRASARPGTNPGGRVMSFGKRLAALVLAIAGLCSSAHAGYFTFTCYKTNGDKATPTEFKIHYEYTNTASTSVIADETPGSWPHRIPYPTG